MHSFFCLSLLLGFAMVGWAQKTYPTVGQILKYDAKLDELIDPSAKIEVLASGFTWAEGPAWVKAGQYLLFSDVPENTIYKWSSQKGLEVFLRPSGYTGVPPYSDEPGSNGLIINQKGELVACEHGDRRLSVMPLSGGGKLTLAQHFEGKRFNSPNDVVQHSSGAYYFTDPPYGLPDRENSQLRELDWFGVYRVSPKGEVTLLTKSMTRPNGLAFSPDEKILYVAQSDPSKAVIMAFEVKSDGTLGEGKILFDATPMVKQGLPGLPDGLRIDIQGNLWTTGPGGVLILTSEGKLLGRIETGEATANCGWGDDGTTLYITADMYLCRLKTRVKGAGW
ncbi:MAG: SMP-30/gluconolactonase/LRE family protein [Runella sp.]